MCCEEREGEESPLLIILSRQAVDYLTTHVQSGSRIDEIFLQTRLKPPRWTKEVIDRVIKRLVDERLLLPRKGRLFEVRSLSESELHHVKEQWTGPMASIGDLYMEPSTPEDPMKRGTRIMQALEAYARGRDYTTAEGCEKIVSYDDFRHPVFRWGYSSASEGLHTDAVTRSKAATPVRRRKISISRMLIDCSPSTASVMSLDEPSNRFREESMVYYTDHSTADSTQTAD